MSSKLTLNSFWCVATLAVPPPPVPVEREAPWRIVNLAADALAGIFAPPSTRSTSRLVLRIGGIDGLSSYAGLLAYLGSLSLVSDVQVDALEGSVVDVRMALRGDRELLARIASLDGRLQPVPTVPEGAPAGADFVYRP